MKDIYCFHSQLILRTPSQPFQLAINEATIRDSLTNASFMEAVYLASPALHEQCRKWQSGELIDPRRISRLQATLTRYYLRSSSRCTPFGLFAGCSVVTWGKHNRIELLPAESTRHTRLDMHYLCALAQQLANLPSSKFWLRYWPNNSLYQVGAELRYIEYNYQHGVRHHQISAIDSSPYLLQLLAAAQTGLQYSDLIAMLSDEEQDQPQAAQFIDELIQAQVLVHELEPTVTGDEFFHRIQQVVTRIVEAAPEAVDLTTIAQILEVVRLRLAALDQTAVNHSASYEQIVAALAPLGVPIEPGKLFQTDMVLGLSAAPTLATTIQDQLLEALDALRYLSAAPLHPRLDDFRRRFQVRYEDREVPLLEALDNENGLSYTEYGQSSYSPLIDDLVMPWAEASGGATVHTSVQQYMLRKLSAATQTGQYSVEVTRTELEDFTPAAEALPPSLGVMFRLIGGGQVLVETVGGASAVNLLGRFAHASPAIGQIISVIAAQEQERNPAITFAEICHLPASRVGNILLRPSFRALEIPYLAQSTRPKVEQAQVKDLLLSVRNQQLVLRSSVTGEQIIPRLSTAHNFSREALPVYQFLCDLQTQGLQSELGFSWRSVSPHHVFLPRLIYQQVVLQPACWRFTQADLQPLLAAEPADFAGCFRQFRERWKLPRLFTLADGDNELLVDAENDLLVGMWLDIIRNHSRVDLKEFLFDATTSAVKDAMAQPYAHQFIALLVRQQPNYQSNLPRKLMTEPETEQREFSIGSEWLYYKLYCGQKAANSVLLQVIQPLTQQLQQQGLIENWFFVRYADPDNHLRLRFYLPDPVRIGEVITLLNHYLQPFIASGVVWRVQTDTYRRELERFGGKAIELAELLFGYQSKLVLNMLADQSDEAQNWLWAMSAAEELLTAFQCSATEKTVLLRGLKEAFGLEFNLDKALQIQLDAKYRVARTAIEQALTRTEAAFVPPDLAAIAQQVMVLVEQQQTLGVNKEQLLGSYLHMLLNRLIPAQARLHELLVYDFLHRYYKSRQAIRQKSG
ncbi:lantibiotic dehydratase [Hymenobacter actinosclerus]|uniref:Thiopeptide-type bacteriocin biosynthesis domain-containing protein n=1 Tax=Hymenobacter actinosclerus TaxID=82805 RepID=A0A1I0DA76_9BACT|nr:lantibiotic dehydratase [Hymenobacter actinosclerus]SET29001.1 thiopeptide-type bacteriocin biosynthesis domain-containing protein [Hymenobacter actinosclerus]